MSPSGLGIQKTARDRWISCFGLRVEERARRPCMALDQTRVDVERLEPLLHELPRLDGEHPAVGQSREQVFAQLRPRQVGQHHERRTVGGQIDEAFAQRQYRSAAASHSTDLGWPADGISPPKTGMPSDSNMDLFAVPLSRRRLADEIRRAARHQIACQQRIDRFHLGTVGVLIVAAVCGVVVWGAATAILIVVAAGLVHGFAPWLERAAQHGELARGILALGNELDREGPGMRPARLCLLQARLDVLVGGLPPSPSGSATIRGRPEAGRLR